MNDIIRTSALEWWADKDEEYKDAVDWPKVMRHDNGHCIVVLYLKEVKSGN